MVSLLLLGGCAKGYKEGIYTGTATDSYGGKIILLLLPLLLIVMARLLV